MKAKAVVRRQPNITCRFFMLITLLTDFGRQDGYAGAMQGVLHQRAPGVTLVTISHEIPAQDVAAGAYVLAQAWEHFPPGTVHLAVVDPGVGSSRRGLGVRAGGHFFVAPDNGLLSHVFAREPEFEARALTESEFWLPRPSRTFHGRDIFAPVAAHLANGAGFSRLGPVIADPMRLPWPAVEPLPRGVRARILHTDHFGNLILNVTARDVSGHAPQNWRARLREFTITGLSGAYADVPEGALLVYWGSAGYLEIAVRGGSAAARTGARRGEAVEIDFLT